ncbi:hypothetical protein [Clostridium oceanicum]|uniref:DUF340 domain-containing protein n=1 Tax=Clostridium oceanicum TaxID=1543 RepID=A0ABP3UK11_9CLOT
MNILSNIITFIIFSMLGLCIGIKNNKKLNWHKEILFVVLAIIGSYVGINTNVISILGFNLPLNVILFSVFMFIFIGRLISRTSFLRRKTN